MIFLIRSLPGVTKNREMVHAGIQSFYILNLFSWLVILAICTLLVWHTKQHYKKVITTLISDVDMLGLPDGATELRKTGNIEIDRLSTQLNLLLQRTQERNNELFEAQHRLYEAQIERQRSVLISLKKQINAHFTVNVLNNIKLLAEQGHVAQAGEMCDGLSFLLRYSNAGDEFINGMEELFILEKYINIMKIRSSCRITVNIDWDDMLCTVNMPRMLVQPMLENAFTHAFANMSEGLITLSAVIEESMIVITVSDNGGGMDNETLFALKNKIFEDDFASWTVGGVSHIALPNIQRRIYSYYGPGHGINIKSSKGKGTEITLRFPVNCAVE